MKGDQDESSIAVNSNPFMISFPRLGWTLFRVPILCLFVTTGKWSTFGKFFRKNGGDDGTRTRGLCRDSTARIGFTTTYKTAGTAKLSASQIRHPKLWVGLWVENFNPRHRNLGADFSLSRQRELCAPGKARSKNEGAPIASQELAALVPP
jgi:hypothetical protein